MTRACSGGREGGVTACDDCLHRADLIAGIAGWLDFEFKRRSAPGRVLALSDEELLEIARGSTIATRYAKFSPRAARAAAEAAHLTTICRCSDAYPPLVRELPDPPAVLHVLGDPGVLDVPDATAVVGARAASGYGIDVARALGRGLSSAGVAVVSGLALGIDSAAHAGALENPGVTIGVLAGSAHVAYPARGVQLHRAVAKRGAIVSEMPPGTEVYRWCFVARNRIIAALSAATVVVQAASRSGSLTTADFAAQLGRTVAAVPGQVTSRLSAGTHALIQAGAPLVTGPGDVLDLLAETTGRPAAERPARRPRLDPALEVLLAAVEDGHGTLGELAQTGDQARAALVGLGELERLGLIRRGFAGRWERAA
jgi:DNA processing protein